MTLRRRDLMKAAGLATTLATSLAMPRLARADSSRVLRFIPQSDLTALDPVWTSVYVTRNHGFAVYDTLYGQDAGYRAQPQMLEGARVMQDGRRWELVLRDGLAFHDGTRVLARDCVASIRRWAARDGFGATLMLATDELSAADDKTIVFRLKAPFPLLPDALGKVGINMCPMMPERLATTDPFRQVTEIVGSGPFRYVADERVVGARVVYAKFDGYVPREAGAPEWTAGPKRAYFDRIEWAVIPDPATAAAAMQRGEADWWEQPVFDLLPLMRRDPKLAVSVVEVTGNIGVMRFNASQKPFDNPAIRRALLPALDQRDFMAAVVGDEAAAARTDVGFFAPGMPMASSAGLAAIAGPRDPDLARARLKAAGYDGERVVMLAPGDYPRINALAQVGADMLRRCGMNVDLQTTDWGSVIQRRASRKPVDDGGWSVFYTTLTGLDLSNPATNLPLRGNGGKAWFGWPTMPEAEILRDQWLAASSLADQQRIAAALQRQAFEDVPFLPLGMFTQPTVQSKSLTGGLQGLTLFWNIRRA